MHAGSHTCRLKGKSEKVVGKNCVKSSYIAIRIKSATEKLRRVFRGSTRFQNLLNASPSTELTRELTKSEIHAGAEINLNTQKQTENKH